MSETRPLFLEDAYLRQAPGVVMAHEDGVVLDRSLFYATGGGQPGDTGWLSWDAGRLQIAGAEKRPGGCIALIPAGAGVALPPLGAQVVQGIDWDRRYAHMRMHSALHLLSVVIPLPVTGGSVGAEKSRVDFAMPEAPADREALCAALNDLAARDLPVTQDWITEEELDANPGLVKTMSVSPPRGAGRIRLIRIGQGEAQVDLQPCGGTHVARTGEIGQLRLGKIEKKGRLNRRVYLHLEG
ncbi:alanyl-tRNA editing protein [Antarcticimicrobium luteum]|uniref:Alanine--tRNA ligase n=1 Tax=Antarcticimicrobium luteum TaxID=2547397 RepID=A0A4V3ASF6_9RHOB|nr:alanyl-tRNA editing protein [Antarcticimicrobium luteum]TDK50290.1 alanyl-tRNA editing protein [Antarcticimicrobium luteum]